MRISYSIVRDGRLVSEAMTTRDPHRPEWGPERAATKWIRRADADTVLVVVTLDNPEARISEHWR